MRWFLPQVLACAVHIALGMFVVDQTDLSRYRSACRPIPPTLYLCRGIEYTRTRFPNLLGHETMREAVQQSAAWVPLVHKSCHADTRKFLCSLFAPVCLEDVDDQIQPCRSLCEAVRSACAPVMSSFGFPWPDMFDCGRFPEDNDLCILPEHANNTNTDTRGPVTPEVLKLKVKEISYMNRDMKIIPEPKSKTVYKLTGVTEREMRKTPLWIKDGLDCMCDEMSDINATYMVMGQSLDRNLVITSLKHLQKGQRDLKQLYRNIHKQQC